MISLKKLSRYSLSAAAILLSASASSVIAGEVTELDTVKGDGFIFIDTEENVVEPGVKAMTTILNNDDYTSANGFSPNQVPNCIMANNLVPCDGPQGSGKRFKTYLTGLGAFDTIFHVVPSGGVTEYFNFAKLTNTTNARITGLRIVIGTGSGDDFVPAAQSSEPLSMDQVAELFGQAAAWEGNGGVDGQNPFQRAAFSAGLFGTGGHNHDSGYFTNPERSGFVFVPEGTDTLAATSIFGGHASIFGDGLLSLNQVPEALVFDHDGDPDTEEIIVFWKAGDLWLDANGIVQDTAAVNTLLQDDAYSIDIIEDLSNVNLNYSFDLGDISGGKLTVRFLPVFSPIITSAQTEYQLNVAAALDQTEIPYLFRDQSAAPGTEAVVTPAFGEFQQVTSALNGLSSPAAIQQGLERAGTSYLRNFGIQSQLLGRDQLEQVLTHLNNGRGKPSFGNGSAIALASADGGAAAAQMLANGNGSTQMSDRVSAFLSGSISTGDIDRTMNGAGADYTGYTIAAGADYRLVDSFRIGAALSYGDNSADVEDNRGKLGVSGFSLLGYATYGTETGFYADIAGGYTWLDFDNKRNIMLGALNREANSKTDGKQVSFAAKAGYNFKLDRVIIGPNIQYQLYDLKVDGYSETGAGVLSMTVDDMDFKSQTLWLGGEASLPSAVGSGFIEPRISAHWVKEFKDDGFVVGTRFTDGVLPFFTPIDGRDKEFVRLGAALVGNFQAGNGRPVQISLNYDGTYGNRDYSQHRFNLRAALRF